MSLQSIRIRNFKAVVDSKTVKVGPLTAFIGNNGAGKSSLIEALETYQAIVRDGLDLAMQRWLGIEHVRHKGQKAKRNGEAVNPISWELTMGDKPRKVRRLAMTVNNDPAANEMFIASERLTRWDGTGAERDQNGALQSYGPGRSMLPFGLDEATVRTTEEVLAWQFLTLSPERMGLPVHRLRRLRRVAARPPGAGLGAWGGRLL